MINNLQPITDMMKYPIKPLITIHQNKHFISTLRSTFCPFYCPLTKCYWQWLLFQLQCDLVFSPIHNLLNNFSKKIVWVQKNPWINKTFHLQNICNSFYAENKTKGKGNNFLFLKGMYISALVSRLPMQFEQNHGEWGD